jgi:dihydroxy-acid dehydratase
LAKRRSSLGVRPGGSDTALRGYDKLFRESVLQAPEGCDFDFLRR